MIDGADIRIGDGIAGYGMDDFGDLMADGGGWGQEQPEDIVQLCFVADDRHGYMRAKQEGKGAEVHVHEGKHGHKNGGNADKDKTDKLYYDATVAEDHDHLFEALPGSKGTSCIELTEVVHLVANETMSRDMEEATTSFQHPMTEPLKPMSSATEPTLVLRGGVLRKANKKRQHAEKHGSTRGKQHRHSIESSHVCFSGDGESYEAEVWQYHNHHETPSNDAFGHGIDITGSGHYSPLQFDRADPFRPPLFNIPLAAFEGIRPFVRAYGRAHGHHTRHQQGYENTRPTMSRDHEDPIQPQPFDFRSPGGHNTDNREREAYDHRTGHHRVHEDTRPSMNRYPKASPFEGRRRHGGPSSNSHSGGRRPAEFECDCPYCSGEIETPHESYKQGGRRSGHPPSGRPHSPIRNGTKARTDHKKHNGDRPKSSKSKEPRTKARTDHTKHNGGWPRSSKSKEWHTSYESEEWYSSTGSEEWHGSEGWQGSYDYEYSYGSFSDFHDSVESLHQVESPPPDYYAILDVSPECSTQEWVDQPTPHEVR